MLHVLNFLPHDYVERRRTRRANVVCVLMAGGCLVVTGLGVGVTFFRAMSIAGVRAVVEKQHQEASLRIKDLERLQKRKEDLLHKAELSATLLERVPRSYLLSRLANHLPPETSLTSLGMEPEKVRVTLKKPGRKEDAKDKKKGKGKSGPVQVTEQRVRFQLDGLAQTDVQVAEYISRLATDPLFESVDLQFSEEFPYKENVVMRRFQLSFLLSREAKSLLENPPTVPAGQASAPPAPPATEEAS